MERNEAIALLPITYQRALSLVADGHSTDDISEELGIDHDAVSHLVELAEAKLARLTAAPANRGSGT